jgi:hypothetical protein
MRKCDEEEEGKETRWRKHPEGGTNNRRAPLVPHSNQRRTSADCLMMKFHRLFHPQRCGEPVAKIQKAKVPAQLSAWSEVMQVAWALEKGKEEKARLQVVKGKPKTSRERVAEEAGACLLVSASHDENECMPISGAIVPCDDVYAHDCPLIRKEKACFTSEACRGSGLRRSRPWCKELLSAWVETHPGTC